MLANVFPNFFLLSVAVVLPLLAALAVAGLGERRAQAWRMVARGAAAMPLFILAFMAFRLVPEAGLQLGDRFEFWPEFGVSLALAVDGLSLPFAILAAALGALGVLAARRPREAALALLAQANAILLFAAADLFVFLAAYWSLPLCLHALINGERRNTKAEYAATKLLVMVLSGAALLSVSLVAVTLAGGNTASLAALLMSKPGFPLAFLNHAMLAGILLAAWVAAPLFPFHTWLADVYEAAPPSALPLVVGGIQAGAVYACLRLAMGLFPGYLEPWLPYMAGLGVLTALYALLASWGQKTLMRMLALVAVAVAGITLAGFSAAMGPEISAAVRSTLTMTLASIASGGLLVWLSAELSRRAEPLADCPDGHGFGAPRAVASWLAAVGVTLVLLVLGMVFMVAPIVAANRLGLTLGLGLALVGLVLTAEGTLRQGFTALKRPAPETAQTDLSPRRLTLAWLALLVAASPLIWLILGNRAIAAFASHLSLGFLR